MRRNNGASSSTAMAAVASSSTAMAAIWQNATAVQVVQNNATAWATFTAATSAVMGKTVAILAGLDPASFADMAAIASSSTAMAAVASSSTAMAAVAANATACQAVEASSAAKTALFNSTLAQTITAQAASSTWTNRRSGKVWLIWHRQSWNNDASTIQVRYTISGNQTISNTAAQTFNTDCRVDRFMTGIENYASAGGIGNVMSYRFIPC